MADTFREFWAQLDAARAEHETTKSNVEACDGWKFLGRLPNGQWAARYGRGVGAQEVREKTAAALVAQVRANHEAMQRARAGL